MARLIISKPAPGVRNDGIPERSADVQSTCLPSEAELLMSEEINNNKMFVFFDFDKEIMNFCLTNGTRGRGNWR